MMLNDGIHPNAKGAAKMADIIFDAIEKNRRYIAYTNIFSFLMPLLPRLDVNY